MAEMRHGTQQRSVAAGCALASTRQNLNSLCLLTAPEASASGAAGVGGNLGSTGENAE